MQLAARELQPGARIEWKGQHVEISEVAISDKLIGGLGLKTAAALELSLSDGRRLITHPGTLVTLV